jgi:hypothetical protein
MRGGAATPSDRIHGGGGISIVNEKIITSRDKKNLNFRSK